MMLLFSLQKLQVECIFVITFTTFHYFLSIDFPTNTNINSSLIHPNVIASMVQGNPDIQTNR